MAKKKAVLFIGVLVALLITLAGCSTKLEKGTLLYKSEQEALNRQNPVTTAQESDLMAVEQVSPYVAKVTVYSGINAPEGEVVYYAYLPEDSVVTQPQENVAEQVPQPQVEQQNQENQSVEESPPPQEGTPLYGNVEDAINGTNPLSTLSDTDVVIVSNWANQENNIGYTHITGPGRGATGLYFYYRIPNGGNSNIFTETFSGFRLSGFRLDEISWGLIVAFVLEALVIYVPIRHYVLRKNVPDNILIKVENPQTQDGFELDWVTAELRYRLSTNPDEAEAYERMGKDEVIDQIRIAVNRFIYQITSQVPLKFVNAYLIREISLDNPGLVLPDVGIVPLSFTFKESNIPPEYEQYLHAETAARERGRLINDLSDTAGIPRNLAALVQIAQSSEGTIQAYLANVLSGGQFTDNMSEDSSDDEVESEI